jgi:hypothetical protein
VSAALWKDLEAAAAAAPATAASRGALSQPVPEAAATRRPRIATQLCHPPKVSGLKSHVVQESGGPLTHARQAG